MTDVFLTEYFPRLNKDLICSIWEYIPDLYLKEVFAYHPDRHISDAAIAASWGKVCLDFIPTRTQSTRPNSVNGISACVKFLETFKDRRFRKLNVVLPYQSALIELVKDLINSIEIAESFVEFIQPRAHNGKDVPLLSLLAIRSLTGLSFKNVDFANTLTLSSHPQIRECKFDNCRFGDSLSIEWPESLMTLDMQDDHGDSSTLNLPLLLKTLKLSGRCDDPLVILAQYALEYGPNTELESIDLKLHTPREPGDPMRIPLESLPQSLTDLGVSFEQFPFAGAAFPKHIKRLTLSSNLLFWFPDTLILWPPMLEYLDMWRSSSESASDFSSLVKSLPQSLKTLRVGGYDDHTTDDDGHCIKLPMQLEKFETMLIDLKQIALPQSLREIGVELCYNNSLGEYDDKTNTDVPKWAQLVNLEKVRVKMPEVHPLEMWRPPANLRELYLDELRILPVLPPQLDSLHALGMQFSRPLSLKDLQLPPNLKVWECNLPKCKFEVPKLVCDHQSLEKVILRCRGYGRPPRFPSGFRGNLVLKILDLLGWLHDRTFTSCNLFQIEIPKFYDSVEEAFGRVLTMRPRNWQTKHYFYQSVY